MTKPITWVDLKGADEFDYTNWNTLGAEADALYDLLAVEHDPSDGEHDTQKVARGWGEFEGDGSTVTAAGLVASVTRVSAGVYTVTLSSNLAAVGGSFLYQAKATLRGMGDGAFGFGFIREKTANRVTGSYRIETFDEFGAAVDRRFFTAVHGTLA